MTHPVAEKVFEVSYMYSYSNNPSELRQEEMKESEILNLKKTIAKGPTSWGATYSNLIILKELGTTDVSNIETWYSMGCKNSWISNAYDPPFTRRSFSECITIGTLVQKLHFSNWCLGQAFYYKNLCFINQIEGGSEWLVIRDDIEFESWSCSYVIREDGEQVFINQVNRMLAATDDQLRKRNYMDAGEVTTCIGCQKKMYPGCEKIFLDGSTCQNCYINKKIYLDEIVSKVKSGQRLIQSDLTYLRYEDSFFGTSKGMESNRGLIFWDNEVAIGHPYGAQGAVDISIYKPKHNELDTAINVEWQLVDKYKAAETV
ncbi:hypothetical protein ASD24_29490 [Paenibacillus sp. Root52]|uniref:hypothetical protein n=1 Tax=Paenibacillus sp. Root52 TaxID=1736552 RepID=UPI0006F9D743|nr:hypothetical protein [Paenibacillus sp. Root52]KQY83743.1 hypothetical protein ASD24_29490 [Paenibacillus sp. Root52]